MILQFRLPPLRIRLEPLIFLLLALIILPISLVAASYIFLQIKDEYFSLDTSVSNLNKTGSKSLLTNKTQKLEEKINNSSLNQQEKKIILEDISKISQEINTLPEQNINKAIEYKDVLALRKEQVNVLNSFLLTIIQILGAFFFIVTAYFSWRNIQTADQKQISERLGEAFKNLAETKPLVCLGAIYLLEQVAQDSPTDRATVVEGLAAFIREKSLPTAAPPSNEYSYAIQKAMDTILEYRQPKYGVTSRTLDLRGSHLIKTKFNNAYLDHVDLQGANLEKSELRGAHLKGAKLNNSHLFGADLSGADLKDADLTNADLNRAGLSQSQLGGAILTNAILEGAELQKANFKNCNGLEIAQLKTARNWEQADYDENFRNLNREDFPT